MKHPNSQDVSKATESFNGEFPGIGPVDHTQAVDPAATTQRPVAGPGCDSDDFDSQTTVFNTHLRLDGKDSTEFELNAHEATRHRHDIEDTGGGSENENANKNKDGNKSGNEDGKEPPPPPIDPSAHCTPAEKLLNADPFYRITRAKRFQQENRADPNAGFVYGIHRILRSHVKGGMGMVHIAYDQFLKREVALKELFRESTCDESIVHRFIVEAEITAQLEHPGIVPIHSLGLDLNGNPYYTMKLIRGRTLQEAIKQYFKEPSEPELKRLVRRFVSVCQTMAFVHKRGVIHRDLKPANIMLGEHGETLVMDWGIAKTFPVAGETGVTVSDTAEHATTNPSGYSRPDLTLIGTVVGTPAFMSPEQASAEPGKLGPISDIFSLGAILFYMLTGRNAHTGKNSQEILTKVLTTAPPKPSEVARNIPPGLEAICLKAMARNPRDRYQCVDDLVADLCNWLDGEPITAMPETVFGKTWRVLRRHQQISLSLFLLLLFFFGVFTFMAVAFVQRHMQDEFTSTEARPVIERIEMLLEEKRDMEFQREQAQNELENYTRQFHEATEAHNERACLHFAPLVEGALGRVKTFDGRIAEQQRLLTELENLGREIRREKKKATPIR